jgi:hypothetical protein
MTTILNENITFSSIYTAVNDLMHNGSVAISLSDFRGQSWNNGSSVPASPNSISIDTHFKNKTTGGAVAVAVYGPTFYVAHSSIQVDLLTWFEHKTITLEECLNYIFDPLKPTIEGHSDTDKSGAYALGRLHGYLTFAGRKCVGFMGDITRGSNSTQFHFFFPGGQNDANLYMADNRSTPYILHRIVDNKYPDKFGEPTFDITEWGERFWVENGNRPTDTSIPKVQHTWPGEVGGIADSPVQVAASLTKVSSYHWSSLSGDGKAGSPYAGMSTNSLSAAYDNTTASIEFKVTGNGIVNIWAKVSSESNYDKAYITVGGDLKWNAVSGLQTFEWQAFGVTDGQVINFQYRKDGSVFRNNDRLEIEIWISDT